jgi:serine/threonine-protein kinase ATR
VNIKPWRGDAALIDFIPPVQAALAVSPSSADNGNADDAFPIMVPRMRTFCSKLVMTMSSKAPPKQIKQMLFPTSSFVGELHFLVKQEAKGNLRKDTRVQDLNNMINCLLAVSGGSQWQHQLYL